MFSHIVAKKIEIRNAIKADDRLKITSPSRPIRAGGHSKMSPKSYLPITLSLCKKICNVISDRKYHYSNDSTILNSCI